MKKIAIFALIFCLASFGTVSAAQIGKIAAVVNGEIITMYDLQKEAIPELIKAGIRPGDTSRKKDYDTIMRTVLDNMILDILVVKDAKRSNTHVTDSEVNAEITRIRKERRMSEKDFKASLAQHKLTIEELSKTIRKNILRQKMMAMQVGHKVVVTPEEIAAYYEAHKDSLYDRNGLHMGFLVYPPNVGAQNIASQIKSGKITFQQAAMKYSIAPNRDKGGDQGPVEWDRLNPEWSMRLNNMKPGDVTPPFKLKEGFWAQIALFRPGGGPEKPLTLEQAKPQIDAILREPKARERFKDYSQQLRSKAVIDIRL